MRMSDQITVTLNGVPVAVARGTTVAVVMMIAGQACRTSVNRELRGPLCGMGICFECRVAMHGQRNRLSCQILCEEGMEVRTDE
jgi:hypothetical protein